MTYLSPFSSFECNKAVLFSPGTLQQKQRWWNMKRPRQSLSFGLYSDWLQWWNADQYIPHSVSRCHSTLFSFSAHWDRLPCNGPKLGGTEGAVFALLPWVRFHKFLLTQYECDLQILHSAQLTGSAGTGIGCKAGTLDISAYLGRGAINHLERSI